MPAPQTVHTRSFRSKMIYLGCIIVLIFPIYWLSQPSSENSVGGFLEHQSGQKLDTKDLGEINMAAETVRLGTFGLDGVAQLMLWLKADEYKKKKEWTELAATLKQLIVLNPHLESVWRFHGWNLAYNVSVEQDNYHERYEWVKEGIRYLELGTRYNPRSLRITWDVGWTISQKMGKSDEHVYFHEFYKNDTEINIPSPETTKRDSWLVGKWWYKRMEALHEDKGVDLQTISPTLFYSYAPLAQAYYSDNLEKPTTVSLTKAGMGNISSAEIDQNIRQQFHTSQNGWNQFNTEWKAFGNLSLESAFGEPMKLIEQEEMEALEAAGRKKLDALSPGKYESLVNEKKRKFLSEAELRALNKPLELRNADELNLASEAEEKIRVSNEEWAQNLPMAQRKKGLEIARQLDKDANQAKLVKRYRNIVNYVYWNLRGELESKPEIMKARKLVYEADRAYEKNDLTVALTNYDQAFQIWANVISGEERFHDILQEDLFASDLREMYDKYELICTQNDPDLRKEEVQNRLPGTLKKVLDTAPIDNGEVERMKMRHDRNMKSGGYVPGKFI